MKKYKAITPLVLFFSCFFSTSAQELLVNQGELSVSPNTVMSVYFDFLNTDDGVYSNDGDVHIRKDFINNGLTFFTNGEQGKTRFIGSEMQTISGSMESDFYDVLFENVSVQPAFRLSSTISISNEAEFSEGIVNNQDYGGLMIFNQSGYHSMVSDDSHVDGFVRKIGDVGFEFPVGDGGYFRHALINAPSSSTDHYTTQYLLENSNDLHPHSSRAGVIELIDTSEYWTIERTSGESDVVVTLSWDEATTPAAITVEPQTAIHIVRWDEDEQLWVNEGGVVDIANKTVSTSFTVEKYGIFTLARVKESDILPGGQGVLTVYNAVTNNDDGVNDVFIIDGLEHFPDNTLTVGEYWYMKPKVMLRTVNYLEAILKEE